MERIVGRKYKLGRKIGSGSFGEIHLEAKPSVKEFVKEIVDLAEPPERQNVESGGEVLREGRWGESDVDEIVHVSTSGFFEGGEMVLLDNQAVLDALLLKADRFSDALLKAGWSGEEVADALGFDFRPEKETRPGKKMSPEMAERIGKLAESFYRL